jgi:uncharacterized protein
MHIDLVQIALGLLSGMLVGFSLGLIGGGGSILAVPLMTYVVGVPAVHIAIGTSAVAVALNAAGNLAFQARGGLVKWQCTTVFAGAGIGGAFAGSSLSKMIDGERLLALFGVLMLVVSGVMFAKRSARGNPEVRLDRENLPKLVAYGFGTGAFSGFFGIGGGFLIVPGLMLASGMPIQNAAASSLVAVAAFGATAAVNYAASGFVNWNLAVVFIIGGLIGGAFGSRAAHWLGSRRGALNQIFAALVCAVAIYVLYRSGSHLVASPGG